MFSLQAPCHLGCCTNTALFCMACYRGAWQNPDSEGRRSLVGTGVQEVWLSMEEAYSWSWGSGKQWEPRPGSWAPPRGACLSSESRASIGVKGRISRRMSIFKSKAGWPQGGTPGGRPSPLLHWNPGIYNGSRGSAEGISGNLLLHGPGALRSSG